MDGCSGLQSTPADQAQSQKGWALAFRNHGEHVSFPWLKMNTI
jgi:hypothetical protein